MKRTIAIQVLIYLLIGNFLFGQNSVLFEVAPKENNTCVYQTESNTTIDLDFEADEATMQDFKAAGMEHLKMSENNKTDKKFQTQKRLPNGKIPVVITSQKKLNQMIINGEVQETEIEKDDIIIYGKYNEDNTLSIDSLGGINTNALPEGFMQEFSEQLAGIMTYPKKELKIGDSFTQNVPFNIPLGDSENLALSVIITYTLKEIKNGEAYFDLVQNYQMNIDTALRIEASGTGTGQMIYDINQKRIKRTKSNADVIMKATDNGVTMKMKMKINTDEKLMN